MSRKTVFGTEASLCSNIIELGVLGKEAIGSIGPKTPEQYQLIDAIKININGFYEPASQNVVATCIDGRLPQLASELLAGQKESGEGSWQEQSLASQSLSQSASQSLSAQKSCKEKSQLLMPNSAGGSLSLWVAATLIGAQLSLSSFLERLKESGIRIGFHTDSHAHAGITGCGANDKLPQILGVVSKKGSLASILALMEKLEIKIDAKAAEQLREAANIHNNSGVFGTASMRINELLGNGQCDVLLGDHNELFIVLNMVHGTTLNRAALAKRFGIKAAVFNIDVWAFKESAAQLNLTELPIENSNLDLSKNSISAVGSVPQKWSESLSEAFVQALAAYNLATGLVLCSSEMPVVIRKS
ncbi:MAG: cadmium-containing carbonic anhydrase [Coriobacteriales bacterium]|jgi:hypothetical protein|nr:cadmium-containing carbonic anhydrase [Coriobacteriales bacterium]